jgi:hypothetical protein
MNWGHKIAITFVLFFLLMSYMVVRSFQENIDLVTDDYYGKELVFQDQINKVENLKYLETVVKSKFEKQGIVVQFPKHKEPSAFSGNIWLYRPSEAKGDHQYAIKIGESYNQIITSADFRSGKYVLKIDWSDGDRDYYQEIAIVVPGA